MRHSVRLAAMQSGCTERAGTACGICSSQTTAAAQTIRLLGKRQSGLARKSREISSTRWERAELARGFLVALLVQPRLKRSDYDPLHAYIMRTSNCWSHLPARRTGRSVDREFWWSKIQLQHGCH